MFDFASVEYMAAGAILGKLAALPVGATTKQYWHTLQAMGRLKNTAKCSPMRTYTFVVTSPSQVQTRIQLKTH